jgi:molybdopterin-guanine dinucleotide biosynthesis protein A
LIAWTADRLRRQVSALAVASRDAGNRFAFLGAPRLPDPPEAGEAGWGPVAGLVAGLAWADGLGADWLVTAPADAPFLADDLAARLVDAAQAAGASVAVAQSATGREPVFAAWRADQAPSVEALARQGVHALHGLAARLGGARCAFPAADPDPFFNVNAPEDLAAAHAIVARVGLRPPQFSAE